MSDINKILNKDEKILWQGKPQFRIYFIETILPVLIIAIVTAVIGYNLNSILINFSLGSLDESTTSTLSNVRTILFFLSLLIAIIGPIIAYLTWRYLLYVLTDKRVIIQSGIIGRDFKMIDYDQFKDAGVNVNLLDKIIGINTGTINIYTGEIGIKTSSSYVNGQLRQGQSSYRISYNFSHIVDPYKVFEMFKKTSFDVKADMDYPNKLRPSENSGYNTKYKEN